MWTASEKKTIETDFGDANLLDITSLTGDVETLKKLYTDKSEEKIQRK